MNKRTLIIVATSTAIGFIGDVVIYSFGQSAGGKFKIHMPKGKNLVSLLVLGVVTGLAIDFAMGQITDAMKNEQEKNLDKLVAAELDRIAKGERDGKIPREVIWEGNKA